MEPITIATAIGILEDLLKAFNNAYWDLSDIRRKDTIFDITCALHEELNEMAKLSIEDHYMEYEPITSNFRSCKKKIKILHSNLEAWFDRSQTMQQLDAAISSANALDNTDS